MKFASSLLALALLAPLSLSARAQDKTTAEPSHREKHTYRLTYTMIENESGKKVGVQRASMVANSTISPINMEGLPAYGRSTMKLGSRIPIVTGSYTPDGGSKVQTQFTYVDVGLNISAVIQESQHGVEVVTKVEQSGLADAPPATPQDPVIRQTSLESSVILTLGKPLLIGSLDIPGSTRHTDIELVVERIP